VLLFEHLLNHLVRPRQRSEDDVRVVLRVALQRGAQAQAYVLLEERKKDDEAINAVLVEELRVE
jgi:hypothetical protein